jgi:RNA polymerase sigma-70 factor (ECF subfamily)
VRISAERLLRKVDGDGMADELESELVRRVLFGDTAAYDCLVAPHLEKAWRLAYGVIHDHALAEDCVSEAAVRAWERLANLEPNRPFKAWFMGIVVRKCLDECRRQRRKELLQTRVQLWFRSSDDWLENTLARDELVSAFRRLTSSQGLAIYLHVVEGWSQAEVAKYIGKSVDTVKRMIRQAKERLRAALEEER